MAGYYHDHLFVDYADGPRATKVLLELQQTARAGQ
jgi:hypothetical protein